ncbi:MAG TPA: hypothetical protein PKV41_04385, partial [Candidatus Omnitrophota bacterium]|nr:hypothetical protein [Candidatus Omnitrophota bacterium]
MNRILHWAVLTTALAALGASPADSASFSDMFGGKKAQEYKAVLEEKEQECQAKLAEKDRLYQQLSNDSAGAFQTIQGLRDKNATLMQAYEKLKVDQGSVTEQITRLRRENQACSDIKSSYDKMTQENQAFMGEKQSLAQKAQQNEATVENLKKHLKEVTAEKDQLAVFLAEAQEDEDVKIKNIRDQVKAEMDGLKKQVAMLTQENSAVAKQLAEAQKQLRSSQNEGVDLVKKMDLLRAELEASEKRQEEIKKENIYLAKEATQFPQKFADLARHNRKLVS